MTPSEDKCRHCDYYTTWSGNYGGSAGYPACNHPKSGPRSVNLLDEMRKCPEE